MDYYVDEEKRAALYPLSGRKLHYDTLQLHGGTPFKDASTNAKAIPIYQSAAFVFGTSADSDVLFGITSGGGSNIRIGNPTVSAFEKRVAVLEGGFAAVATASGQAAQFIALASIARSGDNIIETLSLERSLTRGHPTATSFLYGGTYHQFSAFMDRMGITVKFANGNDPQSMEALIDDRTRAIYCETISNPRFNVPDIPVIAEVAHRHGMPLIVDNTFGACGFIARPLELGADILVESATKWIGGHGIAIGGVIVDSGRFDWSKSLLKERTFTTMARGEILRDLGACMSPETAFHMIQGLETLSFRVERQLANALALAKYLEAHPKVSWVSYPGLPSHEDHERAKILYNGKFGCVLSFGVKGGRGDILVDNLKLHAHLANLGDIHSLIVHPASTTHGQLSEEERISAGVTQDLLRVSVGGEYIGDIIEDYEIAFAQLGNDSLNLDVVELICAHLNNNDLAAVSLVSKSFFAGAVPTLYRTLAFRIHHAKRYPNVSTSFSAILAHPSLAVHVRNIDIRVMPIINNKPHPDFIHDFARALELCNNLDSFVYTPPSANTSAIMPMLQGKAHLKHIRMSARLSTTQAAMLPKLRHVERLELDGASWEVLDVLPKWTESIHMSLTSLTLSMSMDVNFLVLEMTLKQLPRLRGLHLLCPTIDHIEVLRLAMHTPLLESLAFTVTETGQPYDFPLPTPTLAHLQHLALNVHAAGLTAGSSTPTTILSVLLAIKTGFSCLRSATLKIPELTSESANTVVMKLLEHHAKTIHRLTFVSAVLEIRTIGRICKRCKELEVLAMPLPMKDIYSFAGALTSSLSLHTLIDGDGHVSHGTRPTLNQKSVAVLMQRVPSLNRIVDNKRLWTGRRDARGRVKVTLERQPVESVQWFMPPQ
ncbi:hypothetical protein H0H92_014947 [Tricholoma furcatifolium]|nr:hypothetical protein H0H92_014947 [Tricholoma furcatifolium]